MKVRMSRAMWLLAATMVILPLTACGGGGGGSEEEAKARPLPEDEKALRPGEYRSEEFQPPLSFRVGEGWKNVPLEASDELHIRREHETGGLSFANIHEVYKPTRTSAPNVVEAPKDMVGWFQHHPYLQNDKPEPVMVGGVKGVQFDVVVEDLPEDHVGVCGSDCVDIARLSSGFPPLAIWEGDKVRVIVLEDVKGEAVTIDFGSLATQFDEFAPEAQKVLDSVEWKGT